MSFQINKLQSKEHWNSLAKVYKVSYTFVYISIDTPQPASDTPQEMIENKGCTANVLLIKEGNLIVANAGDSRCVASVDQKAVPLSLDHKPTNLGEKTRILKAGSSINAEGRIEGNLNLSRAIGDLKYK